MTAYWSARLLLSLNVLVSVVIAWQDPLTRMAALVSASGTGGWAVMVVLAGASAASVLDVLVNDFAPARYMLLAVYHQRHLLFMAIALGSAAISGVIAMSEGWTPMLLKYWLDAVAGCALAFLEMFARHRKPVP